MAIERIFSCNLCGDKHKADELVGLHYETWPKRWIEKPARDTQNHVCHMCLSSLQKFTPRCGEGYECTGGPNCGSDHK